MCQEFVKNLSLTREVYSKDSIQVMIVAYLIISDIFQCELPIEKLKKGSNALVVIDKLLMQFFLRISEDYDRSLAHDNSYSDISANEMMTPTRKSEIEGSVPK